MHKTDVEYLVSYGSAGEFSRFKPDQPMTCRRGDRVVVRSPEGLELGVVLCPVTAGHASFLSQTRPGELLRRANEEDLRAAAKEEQRAQQLFEAARLAVAELDLPLEILDVDVLLDGQQAMVDYLRGADCDVRPLVSSLSKKFNVLIHLRNLALPVEVGTDHQELGCGKPDCGQAGGGGGCTSCGPGGGCNSCGKSTKKEEVAAYLADLHQSAEGRTRMPLLS